MGYLLAYDADCGPCTRSKETRAFLDAHHNLSLIPLKDADSLGLLGKVSPSAGCRAMHPLSQGGEVPSGTNAIPRLLGLLPAGSVPSVALSSTPACARLTRFIYATMAQLHDSGTCKPRFTI